MVTTANACNEQIKFNENERRIDEDDERNKKNVHFYVESIRVECNCSKLFKSRCAWLCCVVRKHQTPRRNLTSIFFNYFTMRFYFANYLCKIRASANNDGRRPLVLNGRSKKCAISKILNFHDFCQFFLLVSAS